MIPEFQRMFESDVSSLALWCEKIDGLLSITIRSLSLKGGSRSKKYTPEI